MEEILLIIGICFVFFLIIALLKIDGVLKVCIEPQGYFKFGQMCLLFFAIFCFLILLVYNLLVSGTTSRLDVFLTVIVGFLGTIFGLFFGSKAETEVSRKQQITARKAKAFIKKCRKDMEKLQIKYSI